MPQRIELTEFASGYIGGVPIAVAHARGGRVVLFAGMTDADGLSETREECVAACRAYLKRLDLSSRKRQDLGGGELPGH